MFRTWLRSMLREFGGPFVDVFRSKHPCREGAYTCFSPCIGAEEFNYGSRIDHILIAGPCLHENHASENHQLFDCHVGGSDIMIQFIRGNFVGRPKWLGGRSIKLEGSDHVPVYMILNDIPNLPEHSTPPLAVRYVPEVHGWQQTIVPFLRKRNLPDANEHSSPPEILTNENAASENGGETPVAGAGNNMYLKREKTSFSAHFSLNLDQTIPQTLDHKLSKDICNDINKSCAHKMKVPVKKIRCAEYSQLTLMSYFQKPKGNFDCDVERKNSDESLDTCDYGTSFPDDTCPSSSSKSGNRSVALLEWQRIQQKMKMSIPLCKGHGEPCVARSVKKKGPNIGRRFYICARAQGPAANPEANCDHFEWSGKRFRS